MKVSFSKRKQAGLTLVESMVALGISAVVILGALALFGSASSSQMSTQMTSDLSAIRSSVKSLYLSSGGYGSGNLNQVLVNGNKIPTTMSVTAGTPPTITHAMAGTLTIAGNGANFTLTVTAIPTDVCMSLLAGTNGWNSVTVGSGTAITSFPISPATASTQCSVSATPTIVFQSV